MIYFDHFSLCHLMHWVILIALIVVSVKEIRKGVHDIKSIKSHIHFERRIHTKSGLIIKMPSQTKTILIN